MDPNANATIGGLKCRPEKSVVSAIDPDLLDEDPFVRGFELSEEYPGRVGQDERGRRVSLDLYRVVVGCPERLPRVGPEIAPFGLGSVPIARP